MTGMDAYKKPSLVVILTGDKHEMVSKVKYGKCAVQFVCRKSYCRNLLQPFQGLYVHSRGSVCVCVHVCVCWYSFSLCLCSEQHIATRSAMRCACTCVHLYMRMHCKLGLAVVFWYSTDVPPMYTNR